jgi:hypothetical protein
MRFFIVILFLVALPMTAMSQQNPTPAIGSGIKYAPDISPALEARLRHDFLPSMYPEDNTFKDLHSIHLIEEPLESPIPQQQLYFTPFFQQNSLFENPKTLVSPDSSHGILIPDSSNDLKLWELR